MSQNVNTPIADLVVENIATIITHSPAHIRRTKPMRCIYAHGGINWTWYADIEIHDDGSATVHREWRLHNSRDHNHPYSFGRYEINETSDTSSIERFGNHHLKVHVRMAIGVILEPAPDGEALATYPLQAGPVERFSFPGE